MTYTFGFLDDGKFKEVITERPARSAKCLFMWKCGIKRTVTWRCPDNRPAETTESHGHVTILASTVCLETDSAPIEATLAFGSSNYLEGWRPWRQIKGEMNERTSDRD